MLPTPEPEAGTSISIRGVRKSFGAHAVLKDVNFEIPAGSLLALLGPSGCGKTTLLRIIAGLEYPTAGAVYLGDTPVVDIGRGIDVPTHRRRLGMVFQSYALWPHMTIEQNITYPLRKLGVPRGEWATRVRDAIAAVGLPDMLDRRPGQLSGGQQQRVAVARAIVARPRVLLLDEPLSNLDASLRDQLRRELRALHDRQGTTTILVTHDQEEAAMLADTIAVVRGGHIVQAGPPAEILDRPADRQTAEFVGYGNFLSGRIAGGRVTLADGQPLAVPAAATGWADGTEVLIASRSHEVQLGAEGGRLAGIPVTGTLSATTLLGRWRERLIDVGGDRITVRENAEKNPHLSPGERVQVWLPAGSPVLRA